jgi:hypothetical protein
LIFSHWGGRVSVRSPRYRLDNQGKLFDLSVDPGQQHDVALQNADVAHEMRRAVAEWRKNVLSEIKRDKRPFDVGYPESLATRLPARDGRPIGNIRRSSKPPNCSFFTNWISTEDAIHWDVGVHEAGNYQATIYYTCAPEDVGAELELKFGDHRVTCRVNEPHDPPLRGSEHDRVPRHESYVKDFAPLELGVIELTKGRGVLRLAATEIPGQRVIDVSMLELRKLSESGQD